MKIDRKNSVPFYIQVRENIRSQIENGEKKSMESLPSEDILCNKYKVSRITIKKALGDLKREGYIVRIQRKGTFVNFEKPRKEKKQELMIGEKLLAFVVPDIEDIFISEIYPGIKKVATQNGYQAVIFSSDKSIEKEVANIELLKKSNIPGAIIFPCWGRFNALQILELKKRGYPFVLIDRYFRDIQTDMVVVDNYRGAYQAVKYLISLGHRKIGHIMGADCTSNEDRFEGYRAALNQAGIPFNSYLVRKIQPFETEGSLRFEPDDVGGYKETLALLALKKRPTAIFGGNDYLTLGCCKAVKKMGLKIPDDISIVGFDDLKISSYREIPLTTVRQPKYEIGKRACEILIKRIKGGWVKKKVEKIILPTELVTRESCVAVMTKT
ncbi:MAG: GntR family transcriptional regulator [Candidatus Omnitrophota bacterium]